MKRILFVPAALLLALLLLASCGSGTPAAAPDASPTESAAQDAYHKRTTEEAKALIDGGGVTVVDVRTQEEYDESHLPGAVLVTLDTIGDVQPEALPDLDATLVVYCRTGVRSKQASDALVKLGYTDVNDMGGIVSWSAAGYETVSGEG